MTDDIGVFARPGWQSGQTEIVQFADIVESATRRRPERHAFLSAGGQGVSIGAGRLNDRTVPSP